jgi:hypothetical protein
MSAESRGSDCRFGARDLVPVDGDESLELLAQVVFRAQERLEPTERGDWDVLGPLEKGVLSLSRPRASAGERELERLLEHA